MMKDLAAWAARYNPKLGVDPGEATLEWMRQYESADGPGRRRFLAAMGAAVAAAPAAAFAAPSLDMSNGKSYPTQLDPSVMEPVNTHEIEAVAQRRLSDPIFQYISGGAEDEYTLRDNVKAYQLTRLRQHVGVNVSTVDTSLTLLGAKLAYPIICDPTTKNPVVKDGDKLAAIGAHDANAMFGVTQALSFVEDLRKIDKMPSWWICQLGHKNKMLAQTWAKQYADAGAKWIGVTVDHEFTPNRDRNIRNHYGDYLAGVLQPGTPNLTWEYLGWLQDVTKLPIVVKGILNAEDAASAVKYGASMIIVSNHGGRAYDGAVPSLMALPECVAAVKGKIPVCIDGGVRRGTDVLKALSLGATAVLVGRPVAWGLAAFGAVGVQRILELLAAELKISMGIAGAPNLASIRRDMVRLPWEEYDI